VYASDFENMYIKPSGEAIVNMARRPDSLEFAILQRQLAVKDLNSNSWTTQVRELINKYDLPSAYMLLNNPPPKPKWKMMLRKAVDLFWVDHLRQEAFSKKTLLCMNMNIDTCSVGSVHPWLVYSESTLLNIFPDFSLNHYGSQYEFYCRILF
jgi:hypothetical protein